MGQERTETPHSRSWRQTLYREEQLEGKYCMASVYVSCYVSRQMYTTCRQGLIFPGDQRQFVVVAELPV
jgi:hypothetical protein